MLCRGMEMGMGKGRRREDVLDTAFSCYRHNMSSISGEDCCGLKIYSSQKFCASYPFDVLCHVLQAQHP